jgi:hypothetical protein
VEVADAGLALAARRPDVICQIPGNLTAAAFPTLQQAAARARLPIFAFQTGQAHGGAVLAMARDYHDAGRQSAALACARHARRAARGHPIPDGEQDAPHRERQCRATARPHDPR